MAVQNTARGDLARPWRLAGRVEP